MSNGSKIKEIRLSKNMTQAELANLLGVSYVMISQYESGQRNPKIETIKKIATALEVPYQDLLETDSEEFQQFKSGRKAFANKWNESWRAKKMNETFEQLNEEGQEKAIENVELLTKIPDYKK